ncbi:MAG: ribosome maturation factor RimP [Alphaproteobacteria bacterium]|nr:ribosome maturation factor RimP [Alphaproteobacteria bacterium]
MKLSELERHIADLIRPIAAERGVNIVWVNFQGGILQIMAEDPTTKTLGLDDCAALSRAISPVLESEDPISAPYRLEVSSPGVERPLVTSEDFTTYAGHMAKVELDMALNGQKRFKGTLNGIKGDMALMITETGEKELPLDRIRSAHLLLTDEIMAAGKKKTI